MSTNNHFEHIELLLNTVPSVTEEQAAIHLARQYGVDSSRMFHRSIRKAQELKLVWREQIGEIVLISSDKSVMQKAGSKDFPYVYWLYLGLSSSTSPCFRAESPYEASFFAKKKDGSDIRTQVALFDCAGKNPAISLTLAITEETKSMMKNYDLKPKMLPTTLFRVLYLKNCSQGFLNSEDFQLLRGIGFTAFFASNSYNEMPKAVFKEKDVTDVWKRLND